MDIEGVSTGAVLSDYQRLRVENVLVNYLYEKNLKKAKILMIDLFRCSRLGLVSLAYLWRRDQGDLLQEMIDSGVEAVVIKVAALGLDPTKHLGMRLVEIQPHLLKMVIICFASFYKTKLCAVVIKISVAFVEDAIFST